jgi:outer membrane protein assembly factor BamD (BamD/ComL family)
MSSVLKSVIAAAVLACGVFAAGAALAQEEGADTIRKKDGTNVQGQIEAEDVKGVSVKVAKGASITVGWNLIKSIDYAGGADYRKAKQFLDSGQINEAIAVLEDLRKKADFRPLLKAHVLNLDGAAHLRGGDADKAIELFNELFKTFPKTQFLTQGAGENLIAAYLAKGKAADADAALEQLSNAMKQQGLPQEPLNPLRGRVLEATGNFSGAAAAYNQMLSGAGADDGTKAAAELGIARCLVGQNKSGEAEAKYRSIVGREGLPASVLAGAFNGLGKITYDAGFAKKDADLLTNALFHYLRGSVLYTPASGESTTEYERAIRGSADCFKALSEIETNADRKKANAQRAAERLSYLATKFPGSPYRQ